MRTFTPPAVLCLVRKPSALAFALGAGALLEYALDLYPKAPPRTAPGALAGRMLSGAGCGWVVASSRGEAPALGILLGGAGALAGTYGGLALRTRAA
ncbi:MAG TPA: hypothetical protein VGG70_00875, partial [Candidatus Cybelea sp.]